VEGELDNEEEIEEEKEELSETDEESEVSGWVTCKSHRNLASYGDPHVLVGRTFTVPKKYMQKASFAEKCPNGKIQSVARRLLVDEESTEEAEVFFKVYNHQQHRSPPVPDSEGMQAYIVIFSVLN